MSVTVYSVGICNASVCAPKELPVTDVEEQVNRSHPTGLQWGWKPSEDTHFRDGQSNPCACEQDPSRLHYLFSC